MGVGKLVQTLGVVIECWKCLEYFQGDDSVGSDARWVTEVKW